MKHLIIILLQRCCTTFFFHFISRKKNLWGTCPRLKSCLQCTIIIPPYWIIYNDTFVASLWECILILKLMWQTGIFILHYSHYLNFFQKHWLLYLKKVSCIVYLLYLFQFIQMSKSYIKKLSCINLLIILNQKIKFEKYWLQF